VSREIHALFMGRDQDRAMNPSDIEQLYRRRGSMAYDGDGVSQLAHAWQAAAQARAGRAAPPLVLAAWLHDMGHLLDAGADDTPTLSGREDRHEQIAADLLRPLFGAAVAAPVGLHVQAKRFLVAAQPRYAVRLSPDSMRSLKLQGGPMDAQECNDFVARPYATEALRLRVWDDGAKRFGLRPPSTDHALDELKALMAQVRGDQ
jgi:phosphonate degradation associated HDIG domain protein